MPRTTPAEQTAGHVVTTTEYNDQLIKNLNFLLNLEMNGTPLTDFSDGDEIYPSQDYALLASYNGSETVSSLQINSIAQTHRHLMLFVEVQSAEAATTRSLFMRFGTSGTIDTGTNYERTSNQLLNATNTPFSDVGAGNLLYNCTLPLSGATNRYGSLVATIPFYRGSQYKRVHFTYTAALSALVADQLYTDGAGRWLNTGAIDTLWLGASSGNIQNLIVRLYGIGASANE